MDESAQSNPTPATPEAAQLLKMLDLQTAARRGQATPGLPKALQGASFRYGSLVLIVIFTLGSVGMMEWFVSQLPKPVHAAARQPGVTPWANRADGAPSKP
jgi:hypothetical protein